MKLVDQLKNYGYSVRDNKRENGARIITISGKGAWVRCVFKPDCPLSLAKEHVRFLQRSVKNLLQ